MQIQVNGRVLDGLNLENIGQLQGTLENRQQKMKAKPRKKLQTLGSTPAEALDEMKAEPNRKQTSVNAAASTTVGLDCLLAVKNFSSSERLLRITAFILRFIHNTRARAQKSEQQFGELTSKEIEKSDLM